MKLSGTRESTGYFELDPMLGKQKGVVGRKKVGFTLKLT
jgi:hypothetical protein